MDADARRILELLEPAIERAEQVDAQQRALLQRQEESAEAFSAQIADIQQAAEGERARLLEARTEFAALREEELARGKAEAESIVAAANAEETAARARIEELQRAQAQLEAEHAAKLAQAERERAEAEHVAKQLLHAEEEAARDKLREREAEHEARLADLQARTSASVAEREHSFEAACADKRARLQALAVKEEAIQARLAEMQALVAADGPDAFVELRVGGRAFETTVGCLTRFPDSMLAALWHEHRKGGDGGGPVRVNGDPSLFHLVLNFLLSPEELPVVVDVSQIQWLEREGRRYGLEELTQKCRDAYKRLDTVKVMQLLNGQRNLSGMDMRKLDLSDIDFRGASMYRARVGGANLSDALLSGAGTNLWSGSPPPPPRTKWTRRVPHPVLIGHTASLPASFCEVQATRASFAGAQAEGADFSGATAPRADFTGGQLRSAKLGGATLTQASFAGAQAEGADFSKSELADAKLGKANLASASFAGAAAPKADFTGAQLQNANLQGADLQAAMLQSANLQGCDMRGTDLRGAHLCFARFRGAKNLGQAKFTSLRGANLGGCDLTGVNLEDTEDALWEVRRPV